MGIAIACLALAASAFLFIFYIQPDASDSAPHRSRLDQLMDRRDAIYDNLRDLKFEHRAGKYADADYEEMKNALEIEAAQVLAEMDATTGGTPTPSDAPSCSAKGAAAMRLMTPMTPSLSRTISLGIIVVLACASAAAAGTVTGVVHNGTTNKPVPGVDVILLRLQGGMESVATTTADAQGHFQFDRPEIGSQPMLLRVPYRGVNYHQPLAVGAATADVEVYDNTQNEGAIQIAARMIVFQPNGNRLLVGEEYTIHNQTHPPVAYFRADGTFTFSVPENAQLSQVSAWGSSGMPVVQGTIDKGKNRTAIAYAFRPGENGVRLSYEMPYPSNQATIRTASPYAADRVIAVVPPTVQMAGAGFVSSGTEQGWLVYSRDRVPAGTDLEFTISGTAPPPAAGDNGAGASDASGAQNPSVNSRAGENVETGAQLLPARIEPLRWTLVGGFAALFLLGALLLWKRPVALAPAAESRAAPAPAPGPAPAALGEVDRAIRGSLEEIKEGLFRLELRRQAGTITEDAYREQRGRAEKVLRDLLKD